ncbi:AAA domain-containing protein [Actinokineospora sp. NBRC 105648]|uniref:DEAD/DEAH box helicase n=1 Tax=Actinokineospora sp. NBRC 105648 TaxID=3032206 RepID=UPI0024A0301F|nr:AAA domain-containing protein [Actinokineospora sp. NBRC 105648]GLZ43297.1 hypothetical protein Acsp05_69210 [Actinokineospora sp. NBRC 105648]
MSFRTVSLPGLLHLVPSNTLHTQLWEKAAVHPGLPGGVDELTGQLNERADGVPVTVQKSHKTGGDPSLLLHGRAWVARAFPTRNRGGYLLVSVDPLRVRDHHRLSQGCLLVRSPGWRRVLALRDLPPTANAQWETVDAQWQALLRDRNADHGPAELAAAETGFLDSVGRLIEATQELTTAEAGAEPPYPYRAVKPVGERRHGTLAVYEFELVGGRVPAGDTYVQVRGEREQRGQVTRVAERSVTVRFDNPVDWERMSQTGELERTQNTITFAKQREAVELLRDRRARNGALLSGLVDGRVRPMATAQTEPVVDLDPDQLVAFHRALAVEDLLVVLGPPGTGKTRVISAVADACAIGGQRVLVTAHTNRAVDNILARLPRELEVIRVGNDGAVTEDGRPYLLERRASELRARVISGAQRTLSSFGDLETAGKWADELGRRLDSHAASVAAADHAAAALNAARRAVGGLQWSTMDKLATACAALVKSLQRSGNTATAARQWLARADQGQLWARVLRPWWQRRLHSSTAKITRDSVERQRVQVELDAAERALDEATRHAPEVVDARARVDQATRALAVAEDHAIAAAESVRSVLGVAPTPYEGVAGLIALREWLVGRLPLLAARARLLTDWSAEVSGATDQLHPELVRYADVIAATAIGTASRAELAAVDFDVAIIDEAGQIAVADALVPLVRARRVVLVGDHQQLPPFLDSEVAEWGKRIDDPVVRDLMARSALEQLVDRLPPANVVPLTRQRRMPEVIAGFISAQFYRGTLVTAVRREHRGPLFASPLAFVDTSGLPAARRRERAPERRTGDERGYRNPAEAALLIKLAAYYDRLGREWAVIVPYREQIAAVVTELGRRIGDERKAALNVGSVDSFQGGERDVILYGFTRSNPHGNVGFLSELRRANVAFTRAKEQLVLVGDLAMLTTARDTGFRNLLVALRDHLTAYGDIQPYTAIDAKVDE